MSYGIEIWIYRKTLKEYKFSKIISIDHISELVVGSVLKLENSKGKIRKYLVEKREHISRESTKDRDSEYYIQYYIVEI